MTVRSASGDFDRGPDREAELIERNMATLRQRVMDGPLYASTVATAGSLQALVAQVGKFDRVREHDLAAAWRACRAAQPNAGRVVCEQPSGSRTFGGAWDAAVLGGQQDQVIEVAEMKWARSKQFHEVLWDTVKIATALAFDGGEPSNIERGFIVLGAPKFEDLPVELQPIVETGSWTAGGLVLERLETWLRACGVSTPPTQVPAGIALRRIAGVPVLAPGHGADPWELRVLEVTVTDPTPVTVVV